MKMPKLIGILNITPDSCSDGGIYANIQEAVSRAEQMLQDGADYIDIGGESTRPGAQAISPEEELTRVLPVIQALIQNNIRNLSIDTRNASTAKSCLNAGVNWLNDVSALTHDANMITVAKDFDKITLMHMRGTPDNMQNSLSYSDLILEIKTYLSGRIETAVSAGIAKNKIIIDPGLGFGKSTQQCSEILRRLHEFQELGPVYIGPSRKNFIGELTGILEYSVERDNGTLGAVLKAAENGANFIRVHNIKAALHALKVFTA